MYCKNCGKQIDDESRFCTLCGAEQDLSTQQGASPLPNPASQKMETIAARVTRDKREREMSYLFQVNNVSYEVRYFYSGRHKLEVLRNDKTISVVENPGEKVDIAINSNGVSNIRVWFIKGNAISIAFGKQTGVGIEVDGNPVQTTLTDPQTFFNIGRTGLLLAAFFLGFDSMIAYITGFEVHYLVIFPVFFIITLVLVLRYKKLPKVSILAGGIIAILETVNYIAGIPALIQANPSSASWILFWLALRISIFPRLLISFKNLKKV